MTRRRIVGAGLACLVAGACAPAAAADLRVVDELSFTRPDGTAVAFPQKLRVWCGPWDDQVPRRTLHVVVGGRRGRLAHGRARRGRPPRSRGRRAAFFVGDRPERGDPVRRDGGNELSTAEEEASGRITFTRVRCGRRLAVRFRVDAVLGSEFFDGDEWTVRGSFSARR